ncbi:MAG: MarR family transcriptional regulator [Firmicutes bacterium]|nr:MarR family transcriptional regulator [Bacillota bacterium]
MQNTGTYIAILSRQLNLYFNHRLSGIEISATELLYLAQLYKRDGILQEQLADKLSIDRAATTRTVRLMEQKGLVHREIDDLDKRAKKVFLTEKAYAIESKLREIQKSWSDGITCDMTKEEVEKFSEQIRQMAARAKEMNEN